jgi:hypothetical protein
LLHYVKYVANLLHQARPPAFYGHTVALSANDFELARTTQNR